MGYNIVRARPERAGQQRFELPECDHLLNCQYRRSGFLDALAGSFPLRVSVRDSGSARRLAGKLATAEHDYTLKSSALANLHLAKLVSASAGRCAAAATDKVTFQINGEFPVDSNAWREWWREFRRNLHTTVERGRKDKSGRMLCFLTGEAVEPAATHPKITGLSRVGGLTMGDVLVGFKQVRLSPWLTQTVKTQFAVS